MKFIDSFDIYTLLLWRVQYPLYDIVRFYFSILGNHYPLQSSGLPDGSIFIRLCRNTPKPAASGFIEIVSVDQGGYIVLDISPDIG